MIPTLLLPVVLAGCACGVVILFIYLAMTSVKPKKSKAEKDLQYDDEYRIEYGYDLGGHEEELEEEAAKRTRKYQIATVSLYERLLKGLFGHALEFSERFTPRSYIENT